MVRKPTSNDVGRIQDLIKESAKMQEVLPRSLNDIYECIRDFFIYEEDGTILGCAALHVTWDNLAEIRSVVVRTSARGRGIGKTLIEHCCADAQKLGIKNVFLLTEKADFFRKLGFAEVDKATLPHKVWSDCIQCVHFPNCNEIAMVRQV